MGARCGEVACGRENLFSGRRVCCRGFLPAGVCFRCSRRRRARPAVRRWGSRGAVLIALAAASGIFTGPGPCITWIRPCVPSTKNPAVRPRQGLGAGRKFFI